MVFNMFNDEIGSSTFKEDLRTLGNSFNVTGRFAFSVITYMEYRGSSISVALYTDKGEVIRFVEVGKLTKQAVEVFNRWFGGISRLGKEDVITYEKGVITGSIGGVKFKYNTIEAEGTVGDRYVSGLLGKELARLRKRV